MAEPAEQLDINMLSNVHVIEELIQLPVGSDTVGSHCQPLYIYLARTPEIGQVLGRVLSCGARKPEQT